MTRRDYFEQTMRVYIKPTVSPIARKAIECAAVVLYLAVLAGVAILAARAFNAFYDI